MKTVVADTGPIHYLVLIGNDSFFPALFGSILIPASVRGEMLSPRTPASVRKWIENPPSWLRVVTDPPILSNDPILWDLDHGERAAIELAISLQDGLLLTDDRAAVRAAKKKGLPVTGTLGVLDLAAAHGLVDLESAIARLIATNFRYSQSLIDRVLELDRKRRK